jgi:hypothetical protein
MSGPGKPTLDELRGRVRDSFDFYGGSLPRDATLAWDGYFAALVEWGLISVGDHAALVALLPRDTMPRGNDDPVKHILLGWDELSHQDGT